MAPKYLVVYDIANSDSPEGSKRLRTIAQICLGYGNRVQESVFECFLSEKDFVELSSRISGCIDTKADSVRIYRLPKDESATTIFGQAVKIVEPGPLVI
jgi:CRISPR-associated protein Cas2